MNLDTFLMRIVAIALLTGFVAGGCVWYGWGAASGISRAIAQSWTKRKQAALAKAKEKPAPETETAKPAR